LAILSASFSQFLAKIGSDEFLKTFASVPLGAAGGVQVKFEHDFDTQQGANANRSENKAYAAFIAAQSETSKEEYECFKRKYAATNCFGNAKIPFQTFTPGFQVTSAPCLGDQSIAKVVLCKDDCGDTPLARQKTCEKVVCAIKPEIQTCKISRILTSNDENSYDVATVALSSQNVNNKATLLKFDQWAKLQTCHHCGNKGHVHPNCRKYLAEKANGTLPPPGKKRLTRPAPAFNKHCRVKLQKDPKLKALLSAFSAFTTKYLADSQPVASETTANGDDHNNLASGTEDEDDINAFLGTVGALKKRRWSPWFPHLPYSKNDP
jgi:hypothetical protein